jgi:hypothetical protein
MHIEIPAQIVQDLEGSDLLALVGRVLRWWENKSFLENQVVTSSSSGAKWVSG